MPLLFLFYNDIHYKNEHAEECGHDRGCDEKCLILLLLLALTKEGLGTADDSAGKAVLATLLEHTRNDEENRKWELTHLRLQQQEVVECVDNDETAAVIAGLFSTRVLLIMTSTEGIYQDPRDPKTLVRDVTGNSIEDVVRKVRELQKCCVGASRAGANGAFAKLEYALGPVMRGTRVVIGHARHRISDLVEGRVPCTHIGID